MLTIPKEKIARGTPKASTLSGAECMTTWTSGLIRCAAHVKEAATVIH